MQQKDEDLGGGDWGSEETRVLGSKSIEER